MNAIVEAMPIALIGLCLILIVVLGSSILIRCTRDWWQKRAIAREVKLIKPKINYYRLALGMERGRQRARRILAEWTRMEEILWKEPDPEDSIIPYGIPYYLELLPMYLEVPDVTQESPAKEVLQDTPNATVMYELRQKMEDKVLRILGKCCAPSPVVAEEMARELEYDYSVVQEWIKKPLIWDEPEPFDWKSTSEYRSEINRAKTYSVREEHDRLRNLLDRTIKDIVSRAPVNSNAWATVEALRVVRDKLGVHYDSLIGQLKHLLVSPEDLR